MTQDRREEAQAVIDELAAKWRVRFSIEECLDELFEFRSRRRVHEYLDGGWITQDTAERLFTLLDEAG